jgi:hypothetical protein
MDEKEQAAREAQKKIAREQELDDIRWLLSNVEGRRIVWRLLEHAGINKMMFDPDPATNSFKQGMQNEGLWLYAEVIKAAPNFWLLMLKEHLLKTHEGIAND